MRAVAAPGGLLLILLIPSLFTSTSAQFPRAAYQPHAYPTTPPASQMYFGKPGGLLPSSSSSSSRPSVLGWLGSQMAKLSSSMAKPFRGAPKAHSNYASMSTSYAPQNVIFSRPPTSYYGGSAAHYPYPTNSINSIVEQQQHHQGDYLPYLGSGNLPPSSSYGDVAGAGSELMTPQNTIFQVISPDGSSRYQQNPPAGYENFFREAGRGRVQYPQQQQQPYPSSSQLSYQYQHAPAYGQNVKNNIEVLPSTMVAYNKETLSSGHPQYREALEGMSTSGMPMFYKQQAQSQPPQYRRHDTYEQVPRVDSHIGEMVRTVAPQIAPIYDLDAQAPQGPEILASEPRAPVHILSHGSDVGGNPTFEVMADAHAPTFEGGHPFDINQLISMIEPGALVEPQDIVKEDQGNEGYRTGPPRPPQLRHQISYNNDFKLQDNPQTIKDNDALLRTSTLFKYSNDDTPTTPTPTDLSTTPLPTPPVFHKIAYPSQSPPLKRKDPEKGVPYPSSSTAAPAKFPVNPLFDSVLGGENEYYPLAEESQVSNFTITVTPPANFRQKQKQYRLISREGSPTNSSSSSSSSSSSNKHPVTTLVSTQVLNSTSERSSEKRFPVYQKKS